MALTLLPRGLSRQIRRVTSVGERKMHEKHVVGGLFAMCAVTGLAILMQAAMPVVVPLAWGTAALARELCLSWRQKAPEIP
jgi:hypothetical protein